MFYYRSLLGGHVTPSDDVSSVRTRPEAPTFTAPPPPDTPPPPESDDVMVGHDSDVAVADSSTQVHVTTRDSLSSGKQLFSVFFIFFKVSFILLVKKVFLVPYAQKELNCTKFTQF